ncbi:unnamed protein product [Caenorhabditis brenneri]
MTINLLRLPYVVQKTIFEIMGRLELFKLSLCSTRIYKVLGIRRLKIRDIITESSLNQSWIWIQELNKSETFIANFAEYRRLPRNDKTVWLKIGGKSFLCETASYKCIAYRDSEMMGCLQDHFAHLFRVVPEDKGSAAPI